MNENIRISPEIIGEIERIINRGNTAEIKVRKDDVIVLEVKRRILASVNK